MKISGGTMLMFGGLQLSKALINPTGKQTDNEYLPQSKW